MASSNGMVCLARLLLRQGAHVNLVATQCPQGRFATTPLHCAALAGDEQMVHLLIQHGAGVDVCDFLEQSALHMACAGRAVGVVQQLLRHGAVVSARDSTGFAPLHATCHQNLVEPRDITIASVLLKRGADVNQRCLPLTADSLLDYAEMEAEYRVREQTPLHLACNKR